MAEEVKKEKPKKPSFEYKLLSHGDKLGLILEALLDYETALFNHNMNMLDETHSEYDAWKATNDEIKIVKGILNHPNQKPTTANNFASPRPIPSLFLIFL